MPRFLCWLGLFFIFAAAPTIASAQCAPGIPGGGNPSCVPPEVFYNSLPPGSPPPDAGVRWETRWGSLALGGGGFGASTDMPSKRKAQKAALAECERTGGGKQCAVSLSYYNQCAAVAVGDASAGGYVSTTRAVNVEEASRLALQDCSRQGAACRIYYSACSLPVQVR